MPSPDLTLSPDHSVLQQVKMDKVTEETREVEVERSPETQESEEPDEDLNAVFLKGEKLRSRLDDLESTSKEYASVWAEALATYEVRDAQRQSKAGS